KGLVEIDVHRVDAEIARADLADDRVEVRAVAIDEGAHGMNRVADRLHVRLEQAARVGVGDHHRCDVGTEASFQGLEVHAAGPVGGDILHPVAGEGGGGRIGAVCALWDQYDLAL